MKRFAYLAGAVGLSIALAACTSATNSNTNTVILDLVNEATNTAPVLNQNANSSAVLNTNSAANSNVAANVNTNAAIAVSITSSGFSPNTVTVKAGTVVTWTNSSGGDIRVASDPHPTHTDLPGLDSSTLGNGDSYSFTFTKVGTWGYHDHLDPILKGSVTVQ
ncbi:MAG: cupredoxin domain-containing protein [bacterium]|nr:cupredoxin domain-containing protein [bacterium]